MDYGIHKCQHTHKIKVWDIDSKWLFECVTVIATKRWDQF